MRERTSLLRERSTSMKEQKSKQKSSSLSRNFSQSSSQVSRDSSQSPSQAKVDPYTGMHANEGDKLRSHGRKLECDENGNGHKNGNGHNGNDQENKANTHASFSGTASHMAEKVKDVFIEGALAVKDAVTGVGSKITKKASSYVHQANAALKGNAALRKVKKAHQRHEEAELEEKEARALYHTTIKNEIQDLKGRLEGIFKELKSLEDRLYDEAFLLDEEYKTQKKGIKKR